MRAILEDQRSGEVGTYQVPEPELRPGGILVRTAFSAISSGTERAAVEASEKSLLTRAMERPDLVKQVIEYARTNGVAAAYGAVKRRLDTLTPLGYSCSGIVVAVGEGVNEFRCGDRVACAGLGYAGHCEVNWVPRKLAVRVPDSVSLEAASLTTIAAIALQGLRQAQVALGETVVVIGSGLVGVLTMQLARAAGCRVIAVDLDASKVEKAAAFGAQLSLLSSDPRLPGAVREFSRYGADAAIVTAASRSAEPMELAAKVLRDRGRIIVVGDVAMGASRRSLYHKEATIALSRSYGPGRYDPSYEEAGNDYPVGYVRWTEQRNMESVLDFLAAGTVDVSPLLEKRYSVDEAARAYQELFSARSYTAILEYGYAEPPRVITPTQRSGSRTPATGRLRVGCIGAGGFARGFIFPNLKVDSVALESVATASGVAAESARQSFAFARAQTPSELLLNPDLDAVFIASRDSSHAGYVVTALRQGKSVFVEKPLAVSRPQLEQVQRAYLEAQEAGGKPFLMIGFNRRFAPASEKIQAFFAGRQEPMFIHARINAGVIPREHWMQQPSEGGRIIGEFCHFVDWARWLTGTRICTVAAAALPDGARYNRDNLAVTLTFADGSLANLVYLANGDSAVPKEHFEVFCEGAVARLEDFQSVELVRNRKSERIKFAKDKGHRREFQLTLKAMAGGGEAPIPFAEMTEVTEVTFSVSEAITTARPISVPKETPTNAAEVAVGSGFDLRTGSN